MRRTALGMSCDRSQSQIDSRTESANTRPLTGDFPINPAYVNYWQGATGAYIRGYGTEYAVIAYLNTRSYCFL